MTAGDAIPVCLTIAGSDSGGGAGIQADLKTFMALGVHGASAVTCVTAQNPGAVTRIEAISPALIAQQIETVCEGFPVSAAKVGILPSCETVDAVATALVTAALPVTVIDPVMFATSGSRLLPEDAMAPMIDRLLPLATALTPNIPEAEVLSGITVKTSDDMLSAAAVIAKHFDAACIVTGGHLIRTPGQDIVDVVSVDGHSQVFSSPAVPAEETHGTGCTFSAAVTALLAKGMSLVSAIEQARGYVAMALSNAVRTGQYTTLGWSSSPMTHDH